MGTFGEFQKCALIDETGSAHDVPRFLASRSASTCLLVVAVSPAATRSLVAPSAANITGHILEFGNWGRNCKQTFKGSQR